VLTYSISVSSCLQNSVQCSIHLLSFYPSADASLSILSLSSLMLSTGSGSGYLLSIFHQLVSPPSGPSGSVLGIDHLPSLVSLALQNLSQDPSSSPYISSSILNIVSDGRLGAPPSSLPPDFTGFDAIHVGAASSEFPEKLVEQLKEGGRMFVPVGRDWGEQWIWVVDKDFEGKVTKQKLFGVNYIP